MWCFLMFCNGALATFQLDMSEHTPQYCSVDNGKLDLIIQTNTVIKGKKLDLDLPFACGREYKGLTTLMFQDTPLPANADEKQRCIDIITLTE